MVEDLARSEVLSQEKEVVTPVSRVSGLAGSCSAPLRAGPCSVGDICQIGGIRGIRGINVFGGLCLRLALSTFPWSGNAFGTSHTSLGSFELSWSFLCHLNKVLTRCSSLSSEALLLPPTQVDTGQVQILLRELGKSKLCFKLQCLGDGRMPTCNLMQVHAASLDDAPASTCAAHSSALQNPQAACPWAHDSNDRQRTSQLSTLHMQICSNKHVDGQERMPQGDQAGTAFVTPSYTGGLSSWPCGLAAAQQSAVGLSSFHKVARISTGAGGVRG